ncbi:hypothetical protein NEOKW01_0987 [Nematocida sp. AWRm80]|nr:hypothetical protein NEOKW01_0987 [Nematocida sp. AWRm80]
MDAGQALEIINTNKIKLNINNICANKQARSTIMALKTTIQATLLHTLNNYLLPKPENQTQEEYNERKKYMIKYWPSIVDCITDKQAQDLFKKIQTYRIHQPDISEIINDIAIKMKDRANLYLNAINTAKQLDIASKSKNNKYLQRVDYLISVKVGASPNTENYLKNRLKDLIYRKISSSAGNINSINIKDYINYKLSVKNMYTSDELNKNYNRLDYIEKLFYSLDDGTQTTKSTILRNNTFQSLLHTINNYQDINNLEFTNKIQQPFSSIPVINTITDNELYALTTSDNVEEQKCIINSRINILHDYFLKTVNSRVAPENPNTSPISSLNQSEANASSSNNLTKLKLWALKKASKDPLVTRLNKIEILLDKEVDDINKEIKNTDNKLLSIAELEQTYKHIEALPTIPIPKEELPPITEPAETTPTETIVKSDTTTIPETMTGSEKTTTEPDETISKTTTSETTTGSDTTTTAKTIVKSDTTTTGETIVDPNATTIPPVTITEPEKTIEEADNSETLSRKSSTTTVTNSEEEEAKLDERQPLNTEDPIEGPNSNASIHADTGLRPQTQWLAKKQIIITILVVIALILVLSVLGKYLVSQAPTTNIPSMIVN